MKKYEAVFILDLRKVEDDGKAFSEEFAKMIGEMGGQVTDTVLMGRKSFAREINKRKVGVYVDFMFTVDPAQETTIREAFRLDERVLRILIVNDERPEQVRSTLAVVEPVAEEQR